MAKKKKFENYCVVRQEHLNQYGSLFGGHLLQVIDELAFVVCAKSYPGRNFVTRALNDVEFHAPARLGDVLEMSGYLERVGRSSCHVRVQVYVAETRQGRRRLTFDGEVVMVCVDDQGDTMEIKTG
jgi:acyl-CoA hydrolase